MILLILCILQVMGNFSRVLLDAPCSGTGVISKDPSVKANKSEDDVFRCSHLQVFFVVVVILFSSLFCIDSSSLSVILYCYPQKELILAAIDSCNASDTKGGYIVYCTCSIMVCMEY